MSFVINAAFLHSVLVWLRLNWFTLNSDIFSHTLHQQNRTFDSSTSTLGKTIVQICGLNLVISHHFLVVIDTDHDYMIMISHITTSTVRGEKPYHSNVFVRCVRNPAAVDKWFIPLFGGGSNLFQSSFVVNFAPPQDFDWGPTRCPWAPQIRAFKWRRSCSGPAACSGPIFCSI